MLSSEAEINSIKSIIVAITVLFSKFENAELLTCENENYIQACVLLHSKGNKVLPHLLQKRRQKFLITMGGYHSRICSTILPIICRVEIKKRGTIHIYCIMMFKPTTRKGQIEDKSIQSG